jgi:ABC-type histidine transport system ATPase subunit
MKGFATRIAVVQQVAAAIVKKGGGQNARATVARAFCPEPSITGQVPSEPSWASACR